MHIEAVTSPFSLAGDAGVARTIGIFVQQITAAKEV
jgi:hypothetical protein